MARPIEDPKTWSEELLVVYWELLLVDPDWAAEQKRPPFGEALRELERECAATREKLGDRACVRLIVRFALQWQVPRGLRGRIQSHVRARVEGNSAVVYVGTRGVPRIEWEEYDADGMPLIHPPELPPIPYHPARDSGRDFEKAKRERVRRLTESLDEQRARIDDQLRIRRGWRPRGTQRSGRQRARHLNLAARRVYWSAICGKAVKEIRDDEDPEYTAKPTETAVRTALERAGRELGLPDLQRGPAPLSLGRKS